MDVGDPLGRTAVGTVWHESVTAEVCCTSVRLRRPCRDAQSDRTVRAALAGHGAEGESVGTDPLGRPQEWAGGYDAPAVSGGTMGKLDGRTALVSGGARGIGAAIAHGVVEEGGRVVIGDLLDVEGAKLVTELGEERARFVHLDVTDPDQWRDAVVESESAFGAVSVLVNNAGIIRWGSLADMDQAVWHEVLGVNLTGVFLGMHAAIPSLRRAGGGAIVNISSASGLVGLPMQSAYTASKWGVRGLTKSAAVELAREGIRVNSVHPGPIRTSMTEATDPAIIARREQVLASQLIPRMGEPEEVARLVVFLASEEAGFCTGSEFVVDGGAVTGQVRRPPVPSAR